MQFQKLLPAVFCFNTFFCMQAMLAAPPVAKVTPPPSSAVSAADSKAAKALIDKGFEKSGHGDMNEAMALFNQAIKLDPQAPGAYVGRGTVKLEMGKPEEALKDFDLSVKYDKDKHHWTLRHRADLLNNMHRYSKALRDYDVLVNRFHTKDSYHDRAICYLALNKPKLAIEDLNKTLEGGRGKKRHANLERRGDAYLMAGQYQKALTDYDTILREDPEGNRSRDNWARVHQHRGEIFEKLGKHALAKKEKDIAAGYAKETMDLMPFSDYEKRKRK